MTFVTTTCASCGEIEVPVGRVLLRELDAVGGAVCVVRCPSCRARLTKETNLAMRALLESVGVEVSRWRPGVEDRVPALGAITPDEVAAFRAGLEADAALVRHLEPSPGPKSRPAR